MRDAGLKISFLCDGLYRDQNLQP
ncbi:uncharacterized protein METZ01_LOCUS152596, partial [marine metagenome]